MNDIVPKNVSIANAFKHLVPTQSLGEGISAGFTWIGYKGKTWSLRHQGETFYFVRDDDGSPSPYLDVVIVGMNPNISKIYYEGAYDEGSANPPDCASLNGDVPDPGVPHPQSKTCGACPNNVWGSQANGGRGKACQDHRRLAVLIMPYMTKGMLDKPLLEPVFFKVPPGSLKSAKAYGDALQHRGIHWATVITRVTFNPKKQFEMVFSLKQPLTNAEAPVILPLLESLQTKQIIGSMPEIVEATPDIPEEDAVPEAPVETGLLDAFGKGPAEPAEPEQPVKRRPGRPPGSPNKPKLVETKPAAEIEATAEETPTENAETPPWGEADDALDKSINHLLQQRIQGYLK